MTGTTHHNDQIPTDPTRLAGLLLLAAAIVSQLTADQAEALAACIGLAGALNPWIPRGGR